MHLLPGGIPTLKDFEQLKQSDLYRQHLAFNEQFLQNHAVAMERYGKHWGLNPYKLWSRRWEYPFVEQRLTSFFENRSGPIRILDAGSGVTYFPYFILDRLPESQFICCDYNPSYDQMFKDINAARNQPSVSFLQAPLQNLPLEASSLDAICCISVLEHTDNYDDIVKEFARVTKPGGLFVLTFDLSLDGKFTLRREMAAELLGMVGEKFSFPEGFNVKLELDRMSGDGILSTDHVRAAEPQYLPWTKPVRVFKAVQDLFQGRGWTCGFRSRTVFCLDAVRRNS